MSEGILDGCVALVTGASRGIGYQSALAYARAGAKVIAVARTVGGLEDLDDEARATGSELLLVPLDLRDFEGIDRLAPALAERFGRLDVLLGNAAVLGPQTPIAHMDADEWASTLNLNLTANWRLIRALDPLLKAAPHGRALFTTDTPASARAYLAPYAVSKAGLEALVATYALETARSNVTANLIDPGPLRTHLRARYLPGEDQTKLATPEQFAEHLVKLTGEATERTGDTWRFEKLNWADARRD